MQPLTIYQPEIEEYIHTNIELELLDNKCIFSEGPVWNKNGFYLFSDIPANVIYKITPGSPKQIYVANSGCIDESEAELPHMMGSNGLAYDVENNLLVCQHGDHAISKYDGLSLTPIIHSYNNRKLNSPNDIVVDKDASVFFSDPPYGLKDQKLNPGKYQPVAGFYCWRNGQ